MKKILSFLFVLVTIFMIGCGGSTTYIVEFIVDDAVIDTQKVLEGESAVAPKDPIKEGYEFKGWDKEFSNIKSDLKVNAKFEKNAEVKKYTVKFLVDGETVDTQTIEEGKNAVAPKNPTKEGYEFTGWDKEFSNVKSDLEVNALFKENKVYHTVTFIVEGATYATVKVENGKAAELPEQPVLEGKYFAGWRKDTSCVTSDMNVQAKFVTVDLEPKTAMVYTQIAKAPITMYWKGSGIDAGSNASNYNSKIFITEGIVGNLYWFQICINNIDGRLEVVEVSERGSTASTKVCDYSIVAYNQTLADTLKDTGVQVGDVIEFSKNPNSFTETCECDEIFRVKRLGEVTQYYLDSDTAHTVVALHKMQKYFESLGEKISLEQINLVTYEDGSDGTNATKANIVWTSSNPEIVSTEGIVNLPDEVVEVTLVATATYETSTYKQEYKLKVGK